MHDAKTLGPSSVYPSSGYLLGCRSPAKRVVPKSKRSAAASVIHIPGLTPRAFAATSPEQRPGIVALAALVGMAPDFGALAAAHVAFEFMDRRCLRSAHDVQRNGLMRVASKAFHFEVANTRR